MFEEVKLMLQKNLKSFSYCLGFQCDFRRTTEPIQSDNVFTSVTALLKVTENWLSIKCWNFLVYISC